MTLSFSRVLDVWMAGILICSLWGGAAALSADGSTDASVYYGWLDTYQNPSQQVPAIPQPHLLPTPPPFSETLPADQQTPAARAPDSAPAGPGELRADEIVFDHAEAGQGLGCYYHRSYYSHLPMFKEGAYNLPGSLDVAEPYQKTSSNAVSSPSTP
jgi:hypothetical protein